MHPNTMQCTKTWVYGPMWRIGCVHCEKSRRGFVARIFALIAPVHTILHRVLCCYETIPNAPKHYATHQNKSLGSNEVDWVLRCEKSQRDCMARPCALIAPVHPVFAWSFMQLRNDPKCTQTLCNAPKHEFGVQFWLIGCIHCEKSRRDFVARTFALIAPVHPVLYRVWCSYETIPNAPKHYATHQNMSLESNGVD